MKRSSLGRLNQIVLAVLMMATFTQCAPAADSNSLANKANVGQSKSDKADETDSAQSQVMRAVFAGGCFWCMEPPFDKMDGVTSTISGYTGGRTKNPTYNQVKSGRTGHIEALLVTYDPSKVTYQQLLTLFWHNVDPTQANGQFCDKGGQYRAVIFVRNEQERELAEKSKSNVGDELGIRVRTLIKDASVFYPAEDYHQDYYIKNPIKYKYYRYTCGRDARLDALWKTKARKP